MARRTPPRTAYRAIASLVLRLHIDPGNGRDRRQRLTPESERGKMFEIVQVDDLAGGVGGKCQG